MELLGLVFINFILPNWLPIVIAWLVLSKLGSIKSQLGGNDGPKLDKINQTLGGIDSELEDVKSELESVKSELKDINLFARNYYYNSLGLGREWVFVQKAIAEAEAALKKDLSEAESEADYNDACNLKAEAQDDYNEAIAEARAFLERAEAEKNKAK